MEVVLVILALVFFIGAPLGLIAFIQVQSLRGRVDALDRQLARMQTELEAARGTGAVRTLAPPPLDVPPVTPIPEPEREPTPQFEPVALRASEPVLAADVAPEAETPPLAEPINPFKPFKPKTPALDMETLLGAKGSVWIGGLALLLGAVFLLRYSIEAGLLTPGLRVAAAALLGLAALAASEIMARRDLKTPVGRALSARADIPALLAAVGVFSLFGAVYAAHALYGLLPSVPAFALMGVIAVAAMALSLRRGPWLAAIGLIGALAVPLLVSSDTPSYLGVFAYVAIITAAALWVARRESWDWLVAGAGVGATFWLAMLVGKAGNWLEFGLWTLGFAAITALVLRVLRPVEKPSPLYPLAGFLGIGVLAWIGSAAGDDMGALSLVVPIAMFTALIVFAQHRNDRSRDPWRWPVLFIAGLIFALYFVPSIVQGWQLTHHEKVELPIWATPTLAAAFGLAALISARRIAEGFADDTPARALVLFGGLLALLMLTVGIADAVMHEDLVTLIGAGAIASIALLSRRVAVAGGAMMAAGTAWIAGVLWMSQRVTIAEEPGELGNFVMGLNMPWQSLTLSLGAAGALLIALRRDDVFTRIVPVGLLGAAGLLAVGTLDDPSLYYAQTPILNQLWLYFGLPGAVAAAGAVLFGRRRDDIGSQALFAGSLVFTLIMTALLIHHAMNAGDLSPKPGFDDIAVQLLVAFSLLLGGSWVRGDLTRWPQTTPAAPAPVSRLILPALAIAVSLGSLAVFVVCQLLTFNPLFTSATQIDGPPPFNTLLLGFGLPSLLLGGAAIRYAGERPLWFVRILAALAGLSWIAWTTAQIRVFAHGPIIALDRVDWDNAELYAVSAVWLLTAIALLLVGLKTGRRDLRLASGVLMVITILKVFLLDMAELGGVLRPLSFIGLGVVLLGIGRLYQTVLRKDAAEDAAEEETTLATSLDAGGTAG